MRKNYLKIRGGSDQLTNAFANSSELSNKIYLNHAVTSITQNSDNVIVCLLYTSPSPRDAHESRMPSSA